MRFACSATSRITLNISAVCLFNVCNSAKTLSGLGADAVDVGSGVAAAAFVVAGVVVGDGFSGGLEFAALPSGGLGAFAAAVGLVLLPPNQLAGFNSFLAPSNSPAKNALTPSHRLLNADCIIEPALEKSPDNTNLIALIMALNASHNGNIASIIPDIIGCTTGSTYVLIISNRLFIISAKSLNTGPRSPATFVKISEPFSSNGCKNSTVAVHIFLITSLALAPILAQSADINADDIESQNFKKGCIRPPIARESNSIIGPNTLFNPVANLTATPMITPNTGISLDIICCPSSFNDVCALATLAACDAACSFCFAAIEFRCSKNPCSPFTPAC